MLDTVCHAPGGWGPLDPRRFDLTPCFQSALYAVPIAILALGAAVNLPHLRQLPDLHGKGRGATSRWLLRVKTLLALALVGIQAATLALAAVAQHSHAPDIGTGVAAATLVAFVLAAPLHHYAHLRARQSSTVLLFYYLAFLAIDAVRLRTLIDLGWPTHHTASFVLFCLRLATLATVFAFECAGPETSRCDAIRLPDTVDGEGKDAEEQEECPILTANIFSRLTFSWMTPMMTTGYRKFLKEEDLWALPPSDQADALATNLSKQWHRQMQNARTSGGKTTASLPKAIATAFGGPYLEALVLKVFQDLLQFTQPQLLKLLLDFVDQSNSADAPSAYHGYIIAIAMFACGLVQTALLHQYFKRVFETGMRVRGGLISLVYSKSLVLSNDERAGRATGDVVNLMSTDVTRLQDVSAYGLIIFSGIFQLVLAFLSLYQLLGWAMLSGVGIMILSIPLNTVMARWLSKLNKQMMQNKDDRTRLMNEILNNIRSIKLYAYENAFTRRLSAIRNDRELKLLRKVGIAFSGNSVLWSFMPFLVAFSSFAIFAAVSPTPLTPAIVFPALSLFQLLQFPLNVLPFVINSWVEAYVSISRLSSFLLGQELQHDATVREDIVGSANWGDELVSVKNGDFTWSSKSADKTLSGIELSVKKGELVAVVGRVGAGKSSLIAATLGELTKLGGDVCIKGKVAYAAQSPWLLSATIKQNITFGHRWDSQFYAKTIEACALKEDLAMLKDGDETEVGEKGISLSGGQKARISIARAVYARADVYLLDDPLSAVDAHVAKHLFDNVIGPSGILKSKARLLCTNAIPYCQGADELIMLRDGHIIERGSYDNVLHAEGELRKLMDEFGKKTKETENRDNSDENAETIIGSDNVKDAEETDHVSDIGTPKRRFSVATVRRASVIPTDQQKRDVRTSFKSSSKPEEHRSTGSVKWDIYKTYIKANGSFGTAIYIATIILAQAATIVTSFWLKNWSSHNQQRDNSSSLNYYLGVYFALGAFAAILNFANGYVLYALCVVRSARLIHDGMYDAVIRSPMSFFEQTPIGTILNRFSRDVYVVDEVLARVIGAFFRTMAAVIGVVAVISYSVPPFIIVCVPLLFVYKRIQSYYLATSRELKRLDATTKSPIFASFGETLNGVSTIRAYLQQQRFLTENEARVDRNQGAYYPSISCNRWLAVRLEIIGSVIILIAAFLAVGTVHSTRMDSGLVGLLMSYALSTTQALNWVVRAATDVETNIVSLERMIEYTNLTPEAPNEIPDASPPADWPQSGTITFKDYSCRYREDLDLVLKGINIDIKAGEKIGVCGRTGAGKSTITMALYRVIEPAAGTICIDGVDITKIGLHDLRSRLSIIPQDSQCFEGSLRQNLDPSEQHSDDELWMALENARLKEHVQKLVSSLCRENSKVGTNLLLLLTSKDGGLDAKIEEGGSNLSQGQKQLLCLARALIRRSRILVMDEATSAVDPENDRDIQLVIRKEFTSATLFVIAHRLNTIMDCDRIIVLSAGQIVEFDTPDKLKDMPDGIFASMCRESGLLK